MVSRLESKILRNVLIGIFQAELLSLKNYQTTLGLDESVAAQELAAVTRKRAEAHVQAAYEKIRVLRSRGGAAAVEDLKNLLAYNRHMVYRKRKEWCHGPPIPQSEINKMTLMY